MNDVTRKIITYHSMINAIRLRKNMDTTVEALKEDLGISRTTADKIYASLTGKEDDCPLIERQERRTLLCRDMGYFLGISLGSSHIRVVLLGLNFEPVPCDRIEQFSELKNLRFVGDYNPDESNSHSYAFRTPPDSDHAFDMIRKILSGIVSLFLRQAELSAADASASGRQPFPLMGIGFAVAGPVDYDAKLWRSAPRFTSVRNITLSDLIGYENQERIHKLKIFLSIDNNSKTSIISEYQYLLEKNNGCYNEDLALIYIGSGVGSSAVINQTLLRGSHNLSGELGHIRVATTDPDGKITSERSLEKNLQEEESYLQYIPNILNTVNCILGIDRFILVGHSIAKNDKLIPSLMDQRIKFTVTSTQQYCTAETGRCDPSTAAIGAAIEAYFTMCCYDMDKENEERINLAKEISWKLVRS